MVSIRSGLTLLLLGALVGCSADEGKQAAHAPTSSLTVQSSLVPLQGDGAAQPDYVARRPASLPSAPAVQDDLPLWPPASSPATLPAASAPAVAPFQPAPAAPPLLPGAAPPESAVPPFTPAPEGSGVTLSPGAGPVLSDPNPLRAGEPAQFVPAEPALPPAENPLRGEDEGPGAGGSGSVGPIVGAAPALPSATPPATLPFTPPAGAGGLLPHAPEEEATSPGPFTPPAGIPSAPAPEVSSPLPAMPAEEEATEPQEYEIPRPRQKLPRVSSAIPPAGSVRSAPKPAKSSPPAAAATIVAPPPPPAPPPAAAAPVAAAPESPPPFTFPAQPAPALPGAAAPDTSPAVPPFVNPSAPPAQFESPAPFEPSAPAAAAPESPEPDMPSAEAPQLESPPHFVLPEEPIATEPAEAMPPPASAVVEASVATPIVPPVEVEPDEPFEIVRVFYGTDRMPILANQDSLMKRLVRFTPPLILILLSLFGIGVVVTARKITWMIGTTILVILSTLATWHSVRETIAMANLAALEEPQYSADKSYRGQIERGVCEISIPKTHKPGALEGPSILRLEVQEDPRKHITLRKTTRLQTDAFYEQLRAQVANSPDRELLVFVHGFNVTFEDAARRTGQMAKDLKLQGAPVFFSWPADKYFLLTYGKDETNVGWATPHLKEFLLELVEQTDAKAINLVAHSMGSRALTTALREIDLQFHQDARKFNQVVLAAPDIDADDFRDNIAPSIQRTAKQVTLYASSTDIALSASRFFHRNARAGDTSRGLVIVPGMHTIDVSAIDGGPWGHSYYGASDPVLNDLHLLLGSLPPERRTWLKSSEFDGQTYWAFRPLGTASAPAMMTPR